MVPSIAPKTSSEMLHERDTLAELVAREQNIRDELENIRSYQFDGRGRIFGAERQPQVRGEAGNASLSSDSRLDGLGDGTGMNTDGMTTSEEEEEDEEEEEGEGGGEGLFEFTATEEDARYIYDTDPRFELSEDDEPEEFW